MFFGIVLRGSPARLGDISIQPIISQELPSYQDVLQQSIPTTSVIEQESVTVRTLDGTSVDLFNPSRVFVPQTNVRIPIVLPPLPPAAPRIAEEEVLSLVETDADSGITLDVSGISSFRPEILCVTEFNAIRDQGGNKTQYGSNLELMQNLGGLRRGNYLSLLGLTETEKVTTEFQTIMSQEIETADLIASGLKKLDEIASILNVSANSAFSRFFQSAMYYEADSFSAFANTKILMQMAQDIRSILETSSFNLVPSSIDPNRGAFANDPIRLDKSWKDSFTFSYTGKTLGGALPFQETAFQHFKQSLPGNAADRIRVIVNSLSKELRVSRGLSKRNVQTTLNEFYRGSVQGNPFDNIFGEFGETILEIPKGTNSIGSILYLPREGFVLLPFENKFIESRQTAFVPGPRAFLKFNPGNGMVDLTELRKFTQKATEVVNAASVMCRELLEPDISNDSPAYNLQASRLFQYALANILSGFNELSLIQAASRQGRGQEEQIRTSVEIYASHAILQASARDSQLNFLLMQLLLLVAIKKLDTTSSRLLITELGSVSNLSSVVSNNTNTDIFGEVTQETLDSSIALLARRIESRIKAVSATAPQDQEVVSQTVSNYEDNIAVPGQFIREILTSLAATTANTPIKAVIDLLQQIITFAKTDNVIPFLQNGSTRFNQFGISGLLTTCFELVQSIVDHLFNISFVRNGSDLTISTAPEATLGAVNGIQQAIQENFQEIAIEFTNSAKAEVYRAAQSFSRSYVVQSINLLTAEDAITFRALQILSDLVTNLSAANTRATAFFANPPSAFTSNFGIAKNRVQILGAKATLVANREGISLSDSYKRFQTLLELLKTPTFAAGNRVKIFCIGIPTNFTTKLLEIASANTPNELRGSKQQDIVAIKVYKKSSEDDELIWKPKTFIFDLSIFASGTKSYRNTSGDFANRLRQITLLDASNNFTIEEKDRFLIANDTSRPITFNQRSELFENHVRSDLLELLVNLSSGLQMDELSFLSQRRIVNPASDIMADANATILSKAIEFGMITQQEAQEVSTLTRTISNTSNAKVQEMLCTITANESGVASFLKTNVFNPKKFDRVFCLPVDIDDFELDLGNVTEPRSIIIGQQTLAGQLRRGNDGERIYQNRKNEPNALIFDQFFITIEPVVSGTSQ